MTDYDDLMILSLHDFMQSIQQAWDDIRSGKAEIEEVQSILGTIERDLADLDLHHLAARPGTIQLSPRLEDAAMRMLALEQQVVGDFRLFVGPDPTPLSPAAKPLTAPFGRRFRKPLAENWLNS